MPTVVVDGIATRYEVTGSGPPLLMYAPGGFNAVAEAWSTLGIYQKIKLLDHLPAHFTASCSTGANAANRTCSNFCAP
jgi:hypothetical protein